MKFQNLWRYLVPSKEQDPNCDKNNKNTMGKSIIITYILWAFGGWFGLHHFYLGRDSQAFVWWVLVAGYGGVGWFGDVFKIPRYVEEANFDDKYVAKITKEMKKKPHPPFSFYRFIGQIAFGNILAWLTYAAIPIEDVIPGYSLWFLIVLTPLGSAIGVYTVGNIGREKGSIKSALIGAYIPLMFYTMAEPKYYWSSVLSAFAFRTSIQWRRTPPKRRGLCRRVSTLSACGFIYLSLWSSYLYFNMVITNEHGETIHFRDSVKNLLKSPMFQEVRESIRYIYHYYRIHGWGSLWSEIIGKLDPLGERNALITLDIPRGATKEQITQKWRQLSRQWHPDKFQDPEEKARAQQKFMEIKDAYDKLSVIHNKRKQQNSKSWAHEDDAREPQKEDHVEL